MASLFSAAIDLLGLVAVSAAILLTGLLLRDPRLPAWLRSDGIAQGAGLVLTAAFCFAVGFAGNGLIAAKVHYSVVPIVIGIAFVGATLVLWKIFKIGARLARANSAQSSRDRDAQAPGYQPEALKPAA